MGAAIGGITSGTGGIGPVNDLLAGVARSTAADGSRVGGVLQQLVANLTSSLKMGEQAGKSGAGLAGGAKQVLESFQADLTRLAYIAALQKAINKAGKPGPFNVETAVNDLWVALDAVRKGQKLTSQTVQAQMQQQAQLLEMMTNITKQMHDMTSSVIQNMR